MKIRPLNLNIIKDKVQIDMRNLDLKGDIIDIGIKNYGIIYKICKQNDDEVAVEYLVDEERTLISRERYDTAVLFFCLGMLSGPDRKKLIKDIGSYIRDYGEIVIWDLNKAPGMLMDLEVEVLMPNDESQIIKLRNLNPVKRIFMEEIRHLVLQYFYITEEKVGKTIFYLRGRRKGKGIKKDESSIDCT
ncbi:MAG: hypothetical protein Q8930_18005 [Bacillota bacterium]|nr:hypothetical protein [Bacillota bacterium]